jgi:Cu(I)/Ag(I) efflux system membrane fusion protein
MKQIKLILPVVIIALIAGFLLRGCFSSTPDTHSTHSEKEAPTIWTCSMHPQIQLPEPGKCPICGMDLIPLIPDEEELGEREISISPYAAKLMELETTEVTRRIATAEVRMVGKVDYDETRLSYISAWVPGRIDRLFVDYTGIPVKKGDHLAELYSPELLTAQEELIQSIQTQKKLKDSQSTMLIETAQQTIDAVREKLRLWGLTAEQIAQIETRGTPSDLMTIYSPASGIVIHRNAQEGMYIQTGTQIYTIADLSTVWVQLFD